MRPKIEPPICREWERLWKAYQRATSEHVNLIGALNKASASLGKDEARRRIAEVSAAEFSRKAAREALDAHQVESGHR